MARVTFNGVDVEVEAEVDDEVDDDGGDIEEPVEVVEQGLVEDIGNGDSEVEGFADEVPEPVAETVPGD